MRTDELRSHLGDRADLVEPGDARERLAQVDRRVGAMRRRRTAGRAAGTVAVAVLAVTGIVVGGPLLSSQRQPDLVAPSPTRTPADTVVQPPKLFGYQLPSALKVNDVPYQYVRSEVGTAGERVHRMAVLPDRQPQAIAWATPPDTQGLVVVSVDGNEVSRSTAGGLESGLLLSSGRAHLVVVRVTDPGPTTRIGLAVYHWPKP